MYEEAKTKITNSLQALGPQQDDYFQTLRAAFSNGKYGPLLMQHEIITIKAMLAAAISKPLIEALGALREGDSYKAYDLVLQAEENLAELNLSSNSDHPRDKYEEYLRFEAHDHGKKAVYHILQAFNGSEEQDVG